MKKILFGILLVIVFFACSRQNLENSANSADKKIKVITTLFPTYDFAREIGGAKVDVKLLLPPGVEAHSYEPTPKDIAEINNADIFIYTGDLMEPWVAKLLSSINNGNLKIVDASKGIELKEFEFGDKQNEEDGEHPRGKDPHIWTDPVLAKVMVATISNALAEKDAANKDFFEKNKASYDKKLDELNQKFLDLSAKAKKKEIVSGGHFVFGYLFKRYGFLYNSAYEGFSPNAEPTPKQMKALKETIKRTGTKYVYYEELIDPKLAKLLGEESGLKLLLLHGAHNVSKEELESGLTYYEIMTRNIENLKLGLEYSE